MRNQEKNKENGVDPAYLALWGALLISLHFAIQIRIAANSVLSASLDKDTYVVFIADESIKSDNDKLAESVNKGQEALRNAISVSDSMIVCAVLIIFALCFKFIKNRNKKLTERN